MFGQVAVYGVSSILARAINFILVPLYLSRFIDPETGEPSAARYGVLSEYMSYTAFLLVFLTFGMETSYFRFSGKELTEEHAFSHSFTKVFVLGFVGCLGLFFFAEPLSELLRESGSPLYIKVLALIIFLDVVFSVSFARLRNLNKGKKFAMIKFLAIILNVGLNLLLIVYLPDSEKGVFPTYDLGFFILDTSDQVLMVLLSNLISNSIFLFFFFPDLKYLFRYFSKEYFGTILKYAYPIMILGLAGIVNEMLDRILLKEVLPQGFFKEGWDALTAIGIYSANYKFAIFITLAIQAYRYAAEPFFFKKAEEKNSKDTFVQLMNVFTVLLLFAFVSISVFKVEIGELILRREIYKQGLYVVPILLFANVCVGVYYNLSAWYKLTDKTIYGTYIGIGGALLTIVLNLMLIPELGFLGSAIATLIVYFLMMLVSYLLGQKHYPVSYDVVRIVLYSVLAIGLVAFSHFCLEEFPYAWVLKSVVVILFLAVIYFNDARKWLRT